MIDQTCQKTFGIIQCQSEKTEGSVQPKEKPQKANENSMRMKKSVLKNYRNLKTGVSALSRAESTERKKVKRRSAGIAFSKTPSDSHYSNSDNKDQTLSQQIKVY